MAANRKPAASRVPKANQAASRRAIIRALREGATRSAAASAGGIARETFYKWLADDVNATCPYPKEEGGDEWLTFPDAVRRAEDSAEYAYSETLRKAATEAETIETYDREGRLVRRVIKFDWKAAAWWLERRRHESWKAPDKVELSGPEGGPIQSEAVEFQPDAKFLADVAAALAELPPEVREARAPQQES